MPTCLLPLTYPLNTLNTPITCSHHMLPHTLSHLFSHLLLVGLRYHYRAMPTCLLPTHGQQSGTTLKRQQFVDDIYQLLDAFSGINGPHLLGYSLVGYPIYSPYDSRGLLQTGLDNCNGKFYNGSYAYFVSPTFPYIIGCNGPGLTR